MHAIRTTALRERMRQELQLAGLSERTQEAYLSAVRQLATHFGGLRFRAAAPWWLAAPGAADGAPPAISAAEPPRRDGFDRPATPLPASSSHRPSLR